MISNGLRNFKKKKEGLWNFACPICGDSTKDKTKARGYLINYNNSLLYKCHNCNVSLSFANLIKSIDNTLYTQYLFENNGNERVFTKRPEPVSVIKTKKSERIDLPTLDSLEKDHPAVVYARSRKFTLHHMQRLYYTDKIGTWVQKNINKKYKFKDTPRILIPFFDQDGSLTGAQGRALDPEEKLRYITAKKEGSPCIIFGLNFWIPSKETYVVEGALDSLFLPNALATNNANLVGICEHILSDNFVFVFDNERRNKEVCASIAKAVNSGKKVCIWPKTLQYKDINDMVINNVPVLDIIRNSTYSGLEAKIRFEEWKC